MLITRANSRDNKLYQRECDLSSRAIRVSELITSRSTRFTSSWIIESLDWTEMRRATSKCPVFAVALASHDDTSSSLEKCRLYFFSRVSNDERIETSFFRREQYTAALTMIKLIRDAFLLFCSLVSPCKYDKPLWHYFSASREAVLVTEPECDDARYLQPRARERWSSKRFALHSIAAYGSTRMCRRKQKNAIKKIAFSVSRFAFFVAFVCLYVNAATMSWRWVAWKWNEVGELSSNSLLRHPWLRTIIVWLSIDSLGKKANFSSFVNYL